MQAMIFSAGLGTRFKPWTDRHPKALALVNGKSLLQRNVEYLQSFGIKDIIVNVHHFADQVLDAINKNNGWGSRITISDERNELLETGGGLLKAKELFHPGERFITCNVDILTNLDINKLLDFHERNKPLISFGVTNRDSSRKFLFDESMRLYGWENEKTGEIRGPLLTSPQGGGIIENDLVSPPGEGVGGRPGERSGRRLAYSCVVVFEYAVFGLMKQYGFSGKFSLTDLYLALAADHPILGYDHSGDKLVDVGKPGSIALAEKLFP
jgi:N-acetyl-alpha-D-muramate 1-phosphate uridylyltransferase